MQRLFTFIIIIFVCFGCYQNKNKLSFISINIDNNNFLKKDSVFNSIKTLRPDIIEINDLFFNNFSESQNFDEDYINLSKQENITSNQANSLLFANKDLIELLVSSKQIIYHDTLEYNLNIISWYKLRYIKSGYIFYVFILDSQLSLDTKQIKLISYRLLTKINEVTAGAPVIILNKNYKTLIINDLITNEWIDNYGFKAVNNENCIRFYVNDFFKVIKITQDSIHPSSFCNIHIKFSMNTGSVKRNKLGDQLNELLVK